MDDKNRQGKPFVEDVQEGTSLAQAFETQDTDAAAVEWGEDHQERILDKSPKNKSARHLCITQTKKTRK
jgi:hypothetical protein